MTMNILVVDDEELARQRIESLLKDSSEYNICAEARIILVAYFWFCSDENGAHWN